MLLLCISFIASSQPTVISDPSREYRLAAIGDWYRDESGVLHWTELKQSMRYFPGMSESEMLSFGLTTAAIWCHASIENRIGGKLQLAVGNINIDSLQVYIAGKDSVYYFTAGNKIQHWDVQSGKPFFLFDLPKFDSIQDIWIRFRSDKAFVIPATVGSPSVFSHRASMRMLTTGIFAGIFLLLCFHNLFLFLSTREKPYLSFAFFVLLVSPVILLYLGGVSLVFGRSILTLVLEYAPAYFNIGYMAAIWFCFWYLKNMSRAWIRFGHLIQILNLVVILLNLLHFTFYAGRLTVVTSILFLFLIIVLCVFQFTGDKSRTDKLFVLAWTPFFITGLIFLPAVTGLIPVNRFIFQLPQFGLAFELVFLSISLGYRLNILEKEKLALKEQSMEEAKASQEKLELIVAEQTAELNETVELKDRIFQGISQEIRTPLVNTMGVLTLLDSTEISSAERTILFIELKSVIGDIASIMNGLIKWSGIKLGHAKMHKEQFLAESIIETVLSEFAGRLQASNVVLFKDISVDNIFFDPSYFSMMIRNLLYNAIKSAVKPDSILVQMKPEVSGGVICRIASLTGGRFTKELSDIMDRKESFQRYDINTAQTDLRLYLLNQILQMNGSGLFVYTDTGLWISEFSIAM